MSGNQKNLDNHSNQLNPNNDKFYSSRDMSGGRPNDRFTNSSFTNKSNNVTQSDLNNPSNQLNPNNYEYQHSRESGSKPK